MDKLVLYDEYTREQVQRIFDPSSTFTRGSGSWGFRGIVRGPGTVDYIFFVTFGRQQGHHAFDEWVTEEGILMWQSEPGQALEHPRIRHFVNHDHNINNIYLFLRPSSSVDYTNLGRLAYLTHDNEREHPVYFKWQILDWNPPEDVRAMLNLPITLTRAPPGLQRGVPPNVIPSFSRGGQKTSEFIGSSPDYLVEPERVPNLRLAGERLVFHYETQTPHTGCPNQGAVQHASSKYGNSLGYHILSWNEHRRRKFIKVETTKGGNATPFRITEQELRFGRVHADEYAIYRIYGFRQATNSGMFFELRGDPHRHLDYSPTVFRAVPRL